MQERARQLLLPFDFQDRELIEQALPDSASRFRSAARDAI